MEKGGVRNESSDLGKVLVLGTQRMGFLWLALEIMEIHRRPLNSAKADVLQALVVPHL